MTDLAVPWTGPRAAGPDPAQKEKAITSDRATLSYPFARDEACPFAPPSEYKRLRDTEPISKVRLYDGREAWIFTRHEDIRTVLAHPAVSAETLREGFPFLNPADKASKTAQSFHAGTTRGTPGAAACSWPTSPSSRSSRCAPACGA